jgi:hypothetical protein
MPEIPIAVKVNGSTFDTDEAEYQRANTEISKKGNTTFDITDAEIQKLLLNDNSASTAIVDSLNNVNGDLVGGDNTSTKTEAGLLNNRLHLNGTDDYISTNKNLDKTKDFTVCFWYKADVVNVLNVLWGLQRPFDNDRFWVGINTDNKVRVGLGANSGIYSANAITTTNNNLWIIDWDASTGTLRVFVNDDLKVETTTATGNSAGEIFLGANNYYGGTYGFADGAFEQYRNIARLLTASEKTALYNDGNGIAVSVIPTYTETTEVTLPQIDSGSNSTIWDMSSFSMAINPNGESGTILWQYSIENTGTASYNATWLTLAELQAETDGTGRYFHIKVQLGGTTSQDATITDASITANVTTSGGSSKPLVFFTKG